MFLGFFLFFGQDVLKVPQNSAARILTKTKRSDHISPVLVSLHKFRETNLE